MLMAGPDRLTVVQSALADLLGPDVAVAVTDPREAHPAAHPDEAVHVARALPDRQREFAAGRAAVRMALQTLDYPAVPVRAGPDRAPIWPEGLRGSISHTATLCAAALTRDPLHLGLDIEEDTAMDMDLIRTVCTPAECTRIAGPQAGRLAKLIFSAKEAVYKAQYPETGMLFGFDRLELDLDPGAQQFRAVFTCDTGPFAAGDALPGGWVRVADHLVTAVASRQGAHKGA